MAQAQNMWAINGGGKNENPCLTVRTEKARFRALALRRNESDEGLTLETSASESLYGGKFTLSTQLIKPNYLVILPLTQHHSFFRNLPHLFEVIKIFIKSLLCV